MTVARRLFAGVLWLCATYFAIVLVGGLISGGISSYRLNSAGAEFATNAAFERLAGGFAGEDFVETYCEPILMFSLIFSVLGTSMGFLPGTRSAKERKMSKGLKDQQYSARQIKTITVSAWAILVFGSADVILGVISGNFPVFGVLCLALGLYLLLFFLKKHTPKNES